MNDFEKFESATKGKSIEDFVQKVKEMPIYGVYERAVKNKEKDNTTQLLQILVMLVSVGDEELYMLMTNLSLDLLFAMVDQRLRNEILGESEDENAD